MAREYDDSFHPPQWWFDGLATVMEKQNWNDPHVIKLAINADGRNRRWTPDRLVKMRKGKNGTIQLVQAISKATGVPSPVVTPKSVELAEDLKTWLESKTFESAKAEAKSEAVAQALEASVEVARDQIKPVSSKPDERSSRGRGRRRAS